MEKGMEKGKAVVQLKDGVEIARFDSIKEAAKAAKIDPSGISRAIKHSIASAGFHWRWAEANSMDAFLEDYPGYKGRRIWEAQTPDGIQVLHSAEFSEEIKRQQEFLKTLDARLTEAIQEQKIKPKKIPQRKVKEEIGLKIYTTDKHIGAETRNSLFGNDYDANEYVRRIKETLPVIQMVADAFGHLDTVDFIDLGDGPDGVDRQTARKGHELDQNLETTEQFDVFVSSHKFLMDSIVEMGVTNNLKFTAATNDNHNGWFSYVSARAVEEYLNARYPQIVTQVSQKFMFHEEYGIHRFIYTHGKDDQYMKSGFPMILNPKTEEIITNYIDFHGLSKHLRYTQEKVCVHLIKGDLHSSNEQFSSRFRYKNVMSVYGSSSYVQHNYGAGYRGFEFEIVFKNRPLILSGKNFFLEDALHQTKMSG